MAHAQGREPPAHRVRFGALTRPAAGHAGTLTGGLAVTKGKLLLIVLIVALIAAYHRFRHRAVLQPVLPQIATGRHRRLVPHQSAADRGGVLPRLCGCNRPVAARCNHPDACRGCHFRPAVGHGHRLLCLQHRRDVRIPRFALRAARLDSGEVRRQAEGDQRRHRKGRRVLPVHACAWYRPFPFSSSTWSWGSPPSRPGPSTG